MKRSLIALAVLLSAALAFAGSYSITTTAGQDARLERARVRMNKATCGALSLPASCTQPQARAKDSAANVYSNVADYLDRYVIAQHLASLKTADTADDAAQALAAWTAKSDADKNAVCALLGLPSGCEAWPR